MDILCDNSTGQNASPVGQKDRAGQHGHTGPEPGVHYDFKLTTDGNVNSACPLRKHLRESLRQW